MSQAARIMTGIARSCAAIGGPQDPRRDATRLHQPPVAQEDRVVEQSFREVEIVGGETTIAPLWRRPRSRATAPPPTRRPGR